MPSENVGLTVFLINPDRADKFQNAFPATAAGAVTLAAPLDGYFIPMPSAERPPRWATAVQQLLVPGQAPGQLFAQSPGGLLVVNRNEHKFVITFGHAWQKLQDDWLEREFGRRVALNTIADEGIVEIRSEQVLARWHVASDRAPKATRVEEFGVQFDRDLVAAVEGVSTDPRFGALVRGGTSLRIGIPIDGLTAALDRAVQKFASTAYRKKWPEIDNLTPVKDESIIAELEARLDAQLAAGNAPPIRLVLTAAAFGNMKDV